MFRNSFALAPHDYCPLLMGQLGVSTPKTIFNNEHLFVCGGDTLRAGALKRDAGHTVFCAVHNGF